MACSSRIYDAEIAKLCERFPIEESELIFQLQEIKRNIEKTVILESQLSGPSLIQYLRTFDKKINAKDSKVLLSNSEKSRERNIAISQQLSEELKGVLAQIGQSGSPLEVFQALEDARIRYLEQANGPTKSEILGRELAKELLRMQFRVGSSMLDASRQRAFELEAELSKVQGRYEASKTMLDRQKEMTQELIAEQRKNYERTFEMSENRVKELKQLYEQKLNDLQSSQTKPNITDARPNQIVSQVSIDYDQISTEIQKQMRALGDQLKQRDEEKIRLELERESLILQAKYQSELMNIRSNFEAEARINEQRHLQERTELQRKVEHLERIRQEDMGLLLKKEAEIKVLQEHLKMDEKMKASEIEFSGMLCNVR